MAQVYFTAETADTLRVSVQRKSHTGASTVSPLWWNTWARMAKNALNSCV